MDEARAHFEAGQAAWRAEDLPAAEPALRRAMAAAPGEPVICAALGAVLLKAGDLNEGFRLFDAWRRAPGEAGRHAPQLPFLPWRGQPMAHRRLLAGSARPNWRGWWRVSASRRCRPIDRRT